MLATGCGSDDGDSETSATTEWASSLCTAISTWTNALTSSADSLKGGNISMDSLESAADDVKGATDTLVEDLKGVGKPDLEAGEQAKDSVDQLSDELENEVDKIESAVDDVSGVSGVLSAVSTVTATLSTMATQVTSTLDELEQQDAQGELKEAFQQADSCSELSGSGSG